MRYRIYRFVESKPFYAIYLIIKINIFIVYLIILPKFAKWSILPIRLLRINIGKKHL